MAKPRLKGPSTVTLIIIRGGTPHDTIKIIAGNWAWSGWQLPKLFLGSWGCLEMLRVGVPVESYNMESLNTETLNLHHHINRALSVAILAQGKTGGARLKF